MTSQPNFAVIGVAGYIAPRHLRAIKEVGGRMMAALDTSDSVGIIDSYFPEAQFFTEFERFDRFIDLTRRQGTQTDYVAICSPNYLHDAHVRFALRSHAHAICEKPLVLNAWNIDGLASMEREFGRSVSTILQLRLHPTIKSLKNRIAGGPVQKRRDVDLTYITSRGQWYYSSWKVDESKSGGIATNIGVHFFDMLGFVFGPVEVNVVHHRAVDCASGYIEYAGARVRWFLSINSRDLPDSVRGEKRSYRSMTIDGEEIEFSEGFTDLHIASYREILAGRGFTLDDVRPCVETVSDIRSRPIELGQGWEHPFLVGVLSDRQRYRNGRPIGA